MSGLLRVTLLQPYEAGLFNNHLQMERQFRLQTVAGPPTIPTHKTSGSMIGLSYPISPGMGKLIRALPIISPVKKWRLAMTAALRTTTKHSSVREPKTAVRRHGSNLIDMHDIPEGFIVNIKKVVRYFLKKRRKLTPE